MNEGKTCPTCRRDPFEGRPDGVLSDSNNAAPFVGNVTIPLGRDTVTPAGEMTTNIVDVGEATRALPAFEGLGTGEADNHTHNPPAPETAGYNEADTSPEALLDQLGSILNRRQQLIDERLHILNASHDTMLEQQRAWDDRHSALHDEIDNIRTMLADLDDRFRDLRESRERLNQLNHGAG